MINSWKSCQLGDVITLQRGFDLPNQNRVYGEFPIVSSNGISDYHNEYKVKSPGVVTGRYGTIGEVYYITSDFWPLNTSLYVKDFKGNDVRFVNYLLKCLDFKSYNAAGAVPGVNRNHLHKIKIKVPPLHTQKRIASILSAYDDLIENNLKRIKLLEEIAQRTYEEWFVKFRINGEQLPIDEATGLPMGWKLITVNDYVEVIGKGPSLNYDFHGQKYPVINQSCIRNGEIELEKVLYAQELNANKEYCYLKSNDILINSMGQGTLGRVSKNVSIRNERFIIHNCITFLRAKKGLSQFQLYYFISSKQSYFISVSQGSTGQTTLKQSLVGDLEINLPTNSILNSFNNIIEPIWNQMGVLKNQNSNLKQSRDILLPRLMSGTINVES
jgi:type I restriction enzyme S subunit